MCDLTPASIHPFDFPNFCFHFPSIIVHLTNHFSRYIKFDKSFIYTQHTINTQKKHFSSPSLLLIWSHFLLKN